jgi:chromosome segregation ATPase
MTKVKPAKLINKLIAQVEKDVVTIATLDKKCQVARDEAAVTIADLDKARQAALDDVVKAQREALEARSQLAVVEQDATELRKQVQDLRACNVGLSEDNCTILVAHDQTRAELSALRFIVEAERVVARENVDIIDKMQPQLEALEVARQDLNKLLDSVRDRLKRRELEAERAILNRMVVAGARPDLNRR